MDKLHVEETDKQRVERWEREYPSNATKLRKTTNGHDTTNIGFSDVALAKDFADQNLILFRFVPLMGKWFVWLRRVRAQNIPLPSPLCAPAAGALFRRRCDCPSFEPPFFGYFNRTHGFADAAPCIVEQAKARVVAR
jgi:hypothetical protein